MAQRIDGKRCFVISIRRVKSGAFINPSGFTKIHRFLRIESIAVLSRSGKIHPENRLPLSFGNHFFLHLPGRVCSFLPAFFPALLFISALNARFRNRWIFRTDPRGIWIRLCTDSGKIRHGQQACKRTGQAACCPFSELVHKFSFSFSFSGIKLCINGENITKSDRKNPLF